MTEVAHYACDLPRFSRAVVIPKGQDGGYALSVSRNGRVLFLSERPLEELAGKAVVVAIRPWYRRDTDGSRSVWGTSLLVRPSPPVGREVVAASAVVGVSAPRDAAVVLPLSRTGMLSFVAA